MATIINHPARTAAENCPRCGWYPEARFRLRARLILFALFLAFIAGLSAGLTLIHL